MRESLGPSGVVVARGNGRMGLVSFKLSSASSFTVLGRPTNAPNCVSPRRVVSQRTSVHGSVFDVNYVLRGVLPNGPCATVVGHYGTPVARQCTGISRLGTSFVTREGERLSNVGHVKVTTLIYVVLLNFVDCPLLCRRRGDVDVAPTRRRTGGSAIVHRRTNSTTPLSRDGRSRRPTTTRPSSTSRLRDTRLVSGKGGAVSGV